MMVELSLEQYREQLAIQREVGAELERERIIKLLPQVIEMGYISEMLTLEDEMPEILPEAIALIKGEN